MTRTQDGAVAVAAQACAPAADPRLQARISAGGLAAVLHEQTSSGRAQLIAHLADPMAADSRAHYAGWLRRQLNSWARLALPQVSVASLDWPLSSVRPQCLDVVGLLIAPSDCSEGICVAAAHVCVAVAQLSAGLLPAATALAAGRTATGSSTRYLQRCAELADRGPGLDRELDSWGARAHPTALAQALAFSQVFIRQLTEAFDSSIRTGW